MPEEDAESPDSTSPRELREYAERQARDAAEAREELAKLQMRDVFRDAGLDPKNPLHAAVMNGYDGEIAAEKVTEYVAGLGLPQGGQAPAPIPEPSQDEVDAHSRMADAGRGAEGHVSDADAEYASQLKGIVDQAARENWPNSRFNDVYAAAVARNGGSVVIDGVPFISH